MYVLYLNYSNDHNETLYTYCPEYKKGHRASLTSMEREVREPERKLVLVIKPVPNYLCGS